MIDKLEQFDQQLFIAVNGLHANWLDPIMVLLSNKFLWIPLYILLVWLIARQYNWGVAILSLASIGITVGISDRLTVVAFKNVFKRYRPCHNADLQPYIHLVHNHCGGLYGFVSSHAANHTAVAFFLFLLWRNSHPKWGLALLIWAAVICYSRVYLGVHYPADVACGALLGAGIASLTFPLYKLGAQKLISRYGMAKRQ